MTCRMSLSLRQITADLFVVNCGDTLFVEQTRCYVADTAGGDATEDKEEYDDCRIKRRDSVKD